MDERLVVPKTLRPMLLRSLRTLTTRSRTLEEHAPNVKVPVKEHAPNVKEHKYFFKT